MSQADRKKVGGVGGQMRGATPETNLLPWLDRDPSLTRLVERLRKGVEKQYFVTGSFDLEIHDDRIADCVFDGFNHDRKSDQVVVKLTTSTTEINFFRQVNRSRTAGQAVHHIVEWRAGGDVDFLGVGSCKALVLQRGACTMKEKFAQNRLYATDKNNCVFHVVKALEYVHTLRYIHGNLTLENVMMFSRGEIKLIDFANTVALNADMPLHCTPEYCPPEMAKCIVNGLRPLKASPSYDVWCLGVFILKLFSPNLQLQEFVNLSDEDVPQFAAEKHAAICSRSQPGHSIKPSGR
ncbi:hypothetical protein H310_10008 [Aphanomyces invadans]|uniref:Protein kinase domain-containing protein n=1 Tax=Aphanomyces invadans TaxID=157072 RepID=A0A024TRA9_9STRA|nr:hypothetical protein H310_10008 [Aphanomyces invadans]ETV96690.1 hypothetical protein H310_10008 [Aphanomyces invadans]|eukprot:XP_008874467.1 hypothetical protein H310_10008 [Aphanomyces invadans]